MSCPGITSAHALAHLEPRRGTSTTCRTWGRCRSACPHVHDGEQRVRGIVLVPQTDGHLGEGCGDATSPTSSSETAISIPPYAARARLPAQSMSRTAITAGRATYTCQRCAVVSLPNVRRRPCRRYAVRPAAIGRDHPAATISTRPRPRSAPRAGRHWLVVQHADGLMFSAQVGSPCGPPFNFMK